jgi:hypothetical protein
MSEREQFFGGENNEGPYGQPTQQLQQQQQSRQASYQQQQQPTASYDQRTRSGSSLGLPLGGAHGIAPSSSTSTYNLHQHQQQLEFPLISSHSGSHSSSNNSLFGEPTRPLQQHHQSQSTYRPQQQQQQQQQYVGLGDGNSSFDRDFTEKSLLQSASVGLLGGSGSHTHSSGASSLYPSPSASSLLQHPPQPQQAVGGGGGGGSSSSNHGSRGGSSGGVGSGAVGGALYDPYGTYASASASASPSSASAASAASMSGKSVTSAALSHGLGGVSGGVGGVGSRFPSGGGAAARPDGLAYQQSSYEYEGSHTRAGKNDVAYLSSMGTMQPQGQQQHHQQHLHGQPEDLLSGLAHRSDGDRGSRTDSNSYYSSSNGIGNGTSGSGSGSAHHQSRRGSNGSISDQALFGMLHDHSHLSHGVGASTYAPARRGEYLLDLLESAEPSSEADTDLQAKLLARSLLNESLTPSGFTPRSAGGQTVQSSTRSSPGSTSIYSGVASHGGAGTPGSSQHKVLLSPLSPSISPAKSSSNIVEDAEFQQIQALLSKKVENSGAPVLEKLLPSYQAQQQLQHDANSPLNMGIAGHPASTSVSASSSFSSSTSVGTTTAAAVSTRKLAQIGKAATYTSTGTGNSGALHAFSDPVDLSALEHVVKNGGGGSSGVSEYPLPHLNLQQRPSPVLSPAQGAQRPTAAATADLASGAMETPSVDEDEDSGNSSSNKNRKSAPASAAAAPAPAPASAPAPVASMMMSPGQQNKQAGLRNPLVKASTNPKIALDTSAAASSTAQYSNSGGASGMFSAFAGAVTAKLMGKSRKSGALDYTPPCSNSPLPPQGRHHLELSGCESDYSSHASSNYLPHEMAEMVLDVTPGPSSSNRRGFSCRSNSGTYSNSNWGDDPRGEFSSNDNSNEMSRILQSMGGDAGVMSLNRNDSSNSLGYE